MKIPRPGQARASQTARVTFPAFRQEVHTFRRFGVPPVTVRTFWMFGFQRRFVRRWECEMLWPKLGALPQTSHVAATVCLL